MAELTEVKIDLDIKKNESNYENKQLKSKLEKIKNLKDSKITPESGGGCGRFLEYISVHEIEEILNENLEDEK